jgi:dTMP kinase
MKTLTRGILISVEGIDGSGKTTLVKNVVEHLHNQGYPVLATREPGATQLGSVVRGIIQKKDVARTAQAEYLLFAADRAQHFHEVVIPALQRSMIVISDRMSDSSLVYQGYARGLCTSTIETINAWTMQGYSIDLTLYVKVDMATALQRLHARAQALTVFEEKASFTQKIIQGFDELFAHNQRVHTLDGHLDPESLSLTALHAIVQWIHTKQLISPQRQSSSTILLS